MIPLRCLVGQSRLPIDDPTRGNRMRSICWPILLTTLHVAEDACKCFAQVLHGIFAIIGTTSWSFLGLLRGAATEKGACQRTGSGCNRLWSILGRASVQERIASAQDVTRTLVLKRRRLLCGDRSRDATRRRRCSRQGWIIICQCRRNGRTTSFHFRWLGPAATRDWMAGLRVRHGRCRSANYTGWPTLSLFQNDKFTNNLDIITSFVIQVDLNSPKFKSSPEVMCRVHLNVSHVFQIYFAFPSAMGTPLSKHPSCRVIKRLSSSLYIIFFFSVFFLSTWRFLRPIQFNFAGFPSELQEPHITETHGLDNRKEIRGMSRRKEK